MGVPASPEALMAASDEPVLVVEVTAADRALATQGNPPLVSFRVLEVLRGDVAAGAEVHAVWPPFDDPFYAMRNSADALAHWQAAPLPVPMPGETWIVMGAPVAAAPAARCDAGPVPLYPPGVTDGQPPAMLPAHGALRLTGPCRLRATPEARARIAALLAHR
jgi:hypothetical protein